MPAEHVVVLGSGIVGLSTAYYLLTLSPSARVTLVENSPARHIAGGASSFAGGFIACGSSWHETPSQSLATLSWDCHLEMARALDGAERWGYRDCGATGLNVGGEGEDRSKYRTLPSGKGKESVRGEGGTMPKGEWVEGEREELDTAGGVAQVDPQEFCEAVYAHLTAKYPKRFTTLFGNSTALSSPSPSGTRTLTVVPHSSPSSPLSLTALSIVVAAGPWSALLCAQLGLPSIPLINLPGHSLLIRPNLSGYVPRGSEHALPSEAVFAGISGAVGGVHASTSGLARGLSDEEKAEGYTRSPELFVRKNGLIYVAGENTIPETGREVRLLVGGGKATEVVLPNKLPATVDDVRAMLDQRLVGRLKRAAGAVSALLKEENGAVIEREQFCYRPVFPDREPVVGRLAPGVLLATGHGPWGITLAPGTGKVMAELALGKKPSADVSQLGVERFSTVKAKL
ncbi:hypothetical protein JCM10207_002947 [Rhodosporidiobolus poonsookiae]